MTTITATYSPEDNKLRLYASSRLDRTTFERVTAAGFTWAPKQELFVAPMWTPQRADLCIELAGDIEDEDRSLVDRAEERADRFEDYKDKRARDAARTAEQVRRIAEGIPLGQPILVGHHSQRHAERDAKRIEDGMRKAVNLWETSGYWKARAAGAVQHARYKERPDVRARRIKGLESDARKQRKNIENAEQNVRVWLKVPRYEWDQQTAAAFYIAGRCSGSFGGSLYSELRAGRMHGDTAWRLAVAAAEAYIGGSARRWLDHFENRIAYERAMLGESGGLVAERFAFEVGGRVLVRAEWLAVLKLNKGADGALVSISTNRRYGSIVGVEEVQDYRAPDPEDAEKTAAAIKAPPLCNYPGRGFVHITKAAWAEIRSDYKGLREMGAGVDPTKGGTRFDSLAGYRAGSEEFQRHRIRSAMGASLRAHLGAEAWAAFAGEGANRAHGLHAVYIVDQKRTDPPRVGDEPKRRNMARKIAQAAGVIERGAEPEEMAEPASGVPPAVPTIPRIMEPSLLPERRPMAPPEPDSLAADVAAMREALRTGVQAVAAPQLFPTPPALAARMVELADIKPGARVLEPSAGTGRILGAIGGLPWITGREPGLLHAVEIKQGLCDQLRHSFPLTSVHCADFLAIDGPASYASCGDESPEPLGRFDRILMNPPFANGADIAHVTHAVRFLKPGGRLVAIMSAGVTFREDRKTREFLQMVDNLGGVIEPLPDGTFEASGTGVRTVLVVLDAPGGSAQGCEEAQAFAAPAVAPTGRAAPIPTCTADPDQVAAIVENTMRRRAEWATDGVPKAHDLTRAADGLDDGARELDKEQEHQLAANFRAAAAAIREKALQAAQRDAERMS